jgi:hypothetical protein
LAESELTSAGVGSLDPAQRIGLDLGGGLWISNPVEDLVLSFERPHGTFEMGTVVYTGAPIPRQETSLLPRQLGTVFSAI